MSDSQPEVDVDSDDAEVELVRKVLLYALVGGLIIGAVVAGIVLVEQWQANQKALAANQANSNGHVPHDAPASQADVAAAESG